LFAPPDSPEAEAVRPRGELLVPPLDAELPRGTARAPLLFDPLPDDPLPDDDPLPPEERGDAFWPSDAVLTRGLLPSL
jgi:hypothetical protein